MENTHRTRINALIASLGLSKNKFAKAIGTSSAVISKITTTDVNYGVELAEKIISTFPSVSPVWLLTGVGEMMVDEASKNTQVGHRSNTQVEALPRNVNPNSTKESTAPKTDTDDPHRIVEVGPDHWTVMRVVELQHQQQINRVQQQLERVLGRLLIVQELAEELLGVRFDDAKFEALKGRIVQRLRLDDDDPFDKMSDAQKNAHFAARERLLEECAAELDHHLKVLNTGLFHGTSSKGKPAKGSAGELLKDLLAQRRKSAGRLGALEEDE